MTENEKKINRKRASAYYYTQCKKYPWYVHFHSARARCSAGGKYGKRGIRFNLTLEDVGLLWMVSGAAYLRRPSIDRIDSSVDRP